MTVEKAVVGAEEFKELVAEYNPERYFRINVTTGETESVPPCCRRTNNDPPDIPGVKDQRNVSRTAFDSAVSRLRKADYGENPKPSECGFNNRVPAEPARSYSAQGGSRLSEPTAVAQCQYTAPIADPPVTPVAGLAHHQLAGVRRLPDRDRSGDEQGIVDDDGSACIRTPSSCW